MFGIQDAILAVTRKFPSSLYVSTCGFITRDLYNTLDRPGNLYLVGSMGMAAPVGLGVALARHARHVVVLDGDGSFAMNLSVLPMIAENEPHLTHVVLDNGVHESTGGQRPVRVDAPAALALAAGYAAAHRVDSAEELAEAEVADRAPTLLHVRCSPRGAHAGKRVEWTPQQLVARFAAAAAA
ncbi:thiamine pyrophosphate-dependent enzyme (plasmid) [Streptomyces sp. HUAS TT11]|uniref:thiamine pyrophosphate-dependent enzyme n=1 Tax=Streptomyces sp. HUAS TT11 TaxID=3447508 RepID=UPI003F656DE6